MRIILPNILTEVDWQYGPLFFLAGPVQGGDDWQAKCCDEIVKRLPKFYAAIPCRYPSYHRLRVFTVDGEKNQFDRQTHWERFHLKIAALTGCLIFWLPCESKTNPRQGNGPYARDTYGELGEWRGHLMHDPALRIVVGAEQDFPGLDKIKYDFCAATSSNFPIYGTLEETVAAAVRKTQ
jgi:hypothetical protein